MKNNFDIEKFLDLMGYEDTLNTLQERQNYMNNMINNIFEQEQQRKENIENTFENNLFPILNFNNKHMFDIEKFLDISNYATEERISRRKNSEINSQEFFTPYSIVKRMCDKISEEDWSDPNKTFCEPCFGNGQFVVYIIWNRLQHGIDWKTALKTCYGVELMQDNVYETHGRIIKLFDALGIDYDEDEAMDIMLRNLICHDFFTWDFEHWRPYTSDELKQISKKKTVKKTKKTNNQLEIEF